jgi:hypothetical protein
LACKAGPQKLTEATGRPTQLHICLFESFKTGMVVAPLSAFRDKVSWGWNFKRKRQRGE